MTEYVVSLEQSLADELALSIQGGEIIEMSPRGDTVYVKKQLVDSVGKLKVEIFSREHPPPHFRVKYQGNTANFRIDNCHPINGDREILKFKNNVYRWWEGNKAILIETWNRTRPSDCPVGEYQEGGEE